MSQDLLQEETLSHDLLQEEDLRQEEGYQDFLHQPKMSEVFSKPFSWLGITERPTTPVVPVTPSSRLSTTHWYDYLLNHVTQNAGKTPILTGNQSSPSVLSSSWFPPSSHSSPSSASLPSLPSASPFPYPSTSPPTSPSGSDQFLPFLRPTVRPPLFLRPSTSPPTFDLRLQSPPSPGVEHGPPPSEGPNPALPAGDALQTSLDPGLASLLQWLPQGTSFQGLPHVTEVSTGFPPIPPQRIEVTPSAPPVPQSPPGSYNFSLVFPSLSLSPRPLSSAPHGLTEPSTRGPPDAFYSPTLSPSVVLRSQDSVRHPAGRTAFHKSISQHISQFKTLNSFDYFYCSHLILLIKPHLIFLLFSLVFL